MIRFPAFPLSERLIRIMTAAFAVASLLAMLALVTLLIKTVLEFRYGDELAGTRKH